MSKTKPTEPSTLTFPASLAVFGRKPLTVDHEGETILALQIPHGDAARDLRVRYEELIGRAFLVTLDLDAEV